MSDYYDIYTKIIDAQKVLAGIKHVTRLDKSSTFSKMTGGNVYLKLENLQKTGSFKVRGAAYAMSQLSAKQKKAGVIAASAGNHAQGVAYAATSLGIKSKIVMPIFSPVAKINATKSYGAEVILHGSTFDDALAHALETAEKTSITFLHPFDNENVIAGQGTIGLEIIEELPDVELVAIPVGGGGLSTGIAIAIKHQKPDVEVYGVEASSAASMQASFEAGRIVGVEGIDTVCDGIAVKKPGTLTFKIAKDLLDGMVTVDELDVTRTIFLLLERAKLVVEPAGCVALAAFTKGVLNIKGMNAVAILSGGNIDMSLMSRVVEKELYRLGRNVRLKGVISDRVGTLNQVLTLVAESGVSVIELDQDRSDPDIAPNKTELLLILEVPDNAALDRLIELLAKNGFEFELYTD